MTGITHNHVQSTTVRSAAYDDDAGDMHVKFRDGGEYIYHGVPKEVHDAFLIAGSKGNFLHRNIKGKYKYTKI